MSTLALVDCNNFYVSCERVFRPDLKARPVVVLSNNDGCIVARSNEIKALKVPMGAPYHQYHHLLEAHDTAVFSSNYALYGDLSRRVMQSLAACVARVEIYSIDEAFLDLSDIPVHEVMGQVKTLHRRIPQWTGIPVSIGVARTKVLSKVANRIAKQCPDTGGVCDLRASVQVDEILPHIAVADIWGIGRRWARVLQALGIETAAELRAADLAWIRRRFNVVMERIVCELRGEPCLALEQVAAPKQQIIASRSFGCPQSDYQPLREAVSHHVSRAAEKLRQQSAVAGTLTVFIQTNRFAETPQHQGGFTVNLLEATDDTRTLLRYAGRALQRCYRPGFHYNKAGVMLLDLAPRRQVQRSLFTMTSDRDTERGQRLLKAVDAINRSGAGRVFFAAEGLQRGWAMRRSCCSPAYTTRWRELPIVRAH